VRPFESPISACDPNGRHQRRINLVAVPSQGDSHRDKNGDFSKKHGNALICTLRQTYGAGFAPGRSGDEKLSDVLHDLDEQCLTYPIKDLQKKAHPVLTRLTRLYPC